MKWKDQPRSKNVEDRRNNKTAFEKIYGVVRSMPGAAKSLGGPKDPPKGTRTRQNMNPGSTKSNKSRKSDKK